jgi:LiaF transmembrane domain
MSSQPLEPQSPPPPALPPAAMAPAAPYVRLPKSPGLAAFLSLFPGLGQVYNGRIARAFLFFFGFVGSIYLSSHGQEFPFAFAIPFLFFWNMIDAWKGAAAINARFLGGQPEVDDTAVESPLWGASLALFGVLILFNNLGWLDLERLARWWPILLIAVGVYFVYASVQQKKKTAEATDEPPRL